MSEHESNVTMKTITVAWVSLGSYAPEDHVVLQLVEGYNCQIHIINYLNRKDQLILCIVFLKQSLRTY